VAYTVSGSFCSASSSWVTNGWRVGIAQQRNDQRRHRAGQPAAVHLGEPRGVGEPRHDVAQRADRELDQHVAPECVVLVGEYAGGLPAGSISHTSTLKRTNQRLEELTKAPWFSDWNRMLPVSRSRRRTRHLPSVRVGRMTRAPWLKSKRMPSCVGRKVVGRGLFWRVGDGSLGGCRKRLAGLGPRVGRGLVSPWARRRRAKCRFWYGHCCARAANSWLSRYFRFYRRIPPAAPRQVVRRGRRAILRRQ
jgi:hypothetical protein